MTDGERGTPRMPRFEPAVAWDPRFLEGAPELESIAKAAELLREFERWPTVQELDARLSPFARIHFEEQAPKKKHRRRRSTPIDADSLYDGKITLEGVVPTRASSWHDLMNALIWASFPNAKRALHRRQYAAARKRIGAPRARLPGTRTAEEDALTMLDEGGELWLVTDDDMRARAEAGEGDALGAARRLVFGHALLEHVHAGCRDARARRLFLVVGDGVPVDIDEARVRADAALEAFLVRGGC